MGYMIRQIETNAKMTDEVRLEALETVVPYATLQAVVQAHGLQRQRKRKLSAEMGLLMAIAMNLYSHLSLGQVVHKLVQGLRYIWPDPSFTPASKGAVSQIRYEIGAKPVVDLFHRICQPMTHPDTPGAFLYGLRLMALDGLVETIADTPQNERVFGRHTSGRGEAGYPQLQAVYLEEVGAHAVVDAGFWPIHTGERKGGLRLLRSIGAGMLLMWDAGFHSFAMVKQTLARQAHLLGRLPAGVKLVLIYRLPDGSRLVYLTRADHNGHIQERIRVRLIEYTVTDPALPGFGERHRLITSLLDWRLYPALPLAQAYHERWEIEITIDEIDTHQRLAFHPLRSQKPVGVIQELYGLLLAHYAIRKVMLEAAQSAGLDPDRISFTNALRLIGDAIPEFQHTALDQHPALYQRLLEDMARFRLPPRQPRINPRVVKRKMSNFDKKRPEHYHVPQPKSSFADAIQILN
jgi:Insertion element 4 transposase N-terminal/Transposase DDE domain